MKKLIIKKLIVLSSNERASFEVNFSQGLNLVIGQNKTGKSSIIKSILHTLGCVIKFEDDWKKLIQRYALMLEYDKTSYWINRENERYSIFRVKNDSIIPIGSNLKFTDEFCPALMNELGVSMEWTTKEGKTARVSPPHLFAFQYIDQDKGWDEIAQSFKKTNYIRGKWKDMIIKYIVGYQDEGYFDILKDIDGLKTKISETANKINHIQSFLNELKNLNFSIEEHDEEIKSNIENDIEKSNKLLKALGEIDRSRLEYTQRLSELQNIRYEKTLQISILQKHISEFSKDFDYANCLDESIKCPLCGAEYENNIFTKVEIVKDIQSAQDMISNYRSDLKAINKSIDEFVKANNALNSEYKRTKLLLSKTQENNNIIETLKIEGKKDLFKDSKAEIKKINNYKEQLISDKANKEDDLKKLISRKVSKSITEKIKANYEIILKRLSVPNNELKFTNFIPKLKRTGSEAPREIYAYYISLYLYNLERGNNPFSWLIIDTPNQQGQDEKNLKNIHAVFDLLAKESGQVIIGSERETGFEDKASNILRLTDERKCLKKESYAAHEKFFDLLDSFKVIDTLSSH